MSLTSAYAAGMRARTKVWRGPVDLKMWDWDAAIGGLVEVGKVKSFEMDDPTLSEGIETVVIRIAEDAIATKIRLANCQFSIDGELYKVSSRTEPIGYNKRIWRFRLEKTGDVLT